MDGFRFMLVLGAVWSLSGAFFVLITRGSLRGPGDPLAVSRWKIFRTGGPLLLIIGLMVLLVGMIGWLGGGQWRLHLP